MPTFNYLDPAMMGGGQAIDPAVMGGAAPQKGAAPLDAMMQNPNGGVAGNAGAGGFDYMAAAPAGASMPAMTGGQQLQPAAAGTPQTYTSDQFGQWYQGQYGSAIDPALMQQIGAAVGPAGEGGLYSQAQWDQGVGMAQQHQANAKPFFPEFEAPKYEAGPAYQAPGKFQAPTMDQAMSDPGYQFALKSGMDALQNSQAARGLARTGASLKELMNYGQQAASQQYDKVYGRAAQEYGQDYQMGRDAWQMNDAQRRDARDFGYRGASDAFNARFRGKELTFQDMFNRWNTNVNTQTQLALAD